MKPGSAPSSTSPPTASLALGNSSSSPASYTPLVVLFIPEIGRIKKHHEIARQAVIPLLRARHKQGEKPVDFLQWMSDNAQGKEKDQRFLAFIQMQITFAALHTSATAPMQVLYDLCCWPEYIAPLREEIERVTKEHGTLNKSALLKLVKLDSFMKESQRLNPLLLSDFSCPLDRQLFAIANTTFHFL